VLHFASELKALLFHPSPSAVIPRKCAIKITRYETREDDPERDHLAKQVTVEGPSYQLIHTAVKNVTEIMSGIEVWSTEGLKKLEYPPEAIWETIVNAVIHRDYSISDDIHILIEIGYDLYIGKTAWPSLNSVRGRAQCEPLALEFMSGLPRHHRRLVVALSEDWLSRHVELLIDNATKNEAFVLVFSKHSIL
jgi:hypothetical protein